MTLSVPTPGIPRPYSKLNQFPPQSGVGALSSSECIDLRTQCADMIPMSDNRRDLMQPNSKIIQFVVAPAVVLTIAALFWGTFWTLVIRL
jgi:hypothetical protein